MPYVYKHPHLGLTVDCVVFGFDEGELKILLIQRGVEPFQGKWALPGGFVRMDETLESVARRELLEETGVKKVYLEQLFTFGAVNRDPRERVVSVAYFALVKLSDHSIKASTDARQAAWFSVTEVPSLAFDHHKIFATALNRLQSKVQYEPIGFELLPPKFTLSQLQHLYETVLERPIDKRNFRKKILGMGLITELDEIEKEVSHRAARLYSFNDKRYHQFKKQGFHFEI